MICTAQAVASVAGLDVLRRGGNAVDATVAAALVLNVTYPMACGIGGDVFALIYEAKTGRVYGVNASGIAPYNASYESFRSLGYEAMPADGMLSVAVPGGVKAYFDILERFGTLSFAELVQPAIRYAEEGFVVSPKLARAFSEAEAKLRRYPTSVRVYLADGRPPGAGDVLRQPDLAKTLRLIADGGPEVFYRGQIADQILAYAGKHGGIWRGDEWGTQHTDIYYPPLVVNYRDRYQVFQTAPPSQGMIMLEELNLVEGFALARHEAKELGPGDGTADPPQADAASVHVMLEAKKLAFADRNRYAGDPRFVDFPLGTLLSKEFAAKRRAEIDPTRASSLVNAADLDGDTTSHVCADAEGNVVSFIHSLSNSFGCCEVAGKTGVLLNNRAGRGFVLDKSHPNCVAPGKKTMHTLNTFLVQRDGDPYCVGNTPGGDGQPQWNLQVLTNLLDLGMSAGEALAAPRWQNIPGTDPAGLHRPPQTVVESRMAPEVRESLLQLGHSLRVVGPWAGGGDAQLIRLHHNRVLEGASDPRGDGVAIGI